MANRRRPASSSIRTETHDNGDRSTTDREKEELVRRMDWLEKMLNDRLSSEDIQIKELQERVQQLEDQVTQYKIQVKILEDKVTSLEQRHSKDSEVVSVTSTNIKDDVTTANRQQEKPNDSTGNLNAQVASKTETSSDIDHTVREKTSDAIVPSDDERSTTSKLQSINNNSLEPNTEVDNEAGLSCLEESITDTSIADLGDWMCSRSRGESLWSDYSHQNFLLNYLGKIYNQKDRIRSIFNELRYNIQDADELDILYELIQRLKQQIGAKRSLHKQQVDNRPSSRLRELASIFEYNSNSCWSSMHWKTTPSTSNMQELVDRQSVKAYFDLICRDGLITAEIGEYFHLKKENIFGGNEYDAHNERITFVPVDLTQSTIKLADNCVDLISCFATLHHVPHLNSMLRELVRILKPEGHLILREHDCKAARSRQVKYLNFIHGIMRIAKIGEYASTSAESTNQLQTVDDNSNANTNDWAQEKLDVIQDASSIQYRTCNELNQELERVGFRHKMTFKYDSNSYHPLAVFYAIYQSSRK